MTHFEHKTTKLPLMKKSQSMRTFATDYLIIDNIL